MVDAKWLFQNYRTYSSRIQVLEYLLTQSESTHMSDDTIIEMLTYQRSSNPRSGQCSYHSSRTEYTAIHLDDFRRKSNDQLLAVRSTWEKELSQLSLYVHMHNAVLQALTPEEKTLVQLHYTDRYTIEEITQLSLSSRPDGLKSKSTLRRMLRSIDRKCQAIINIAITEAQDPYSTS